MTKAFILQVEGQSPSVLLSQQDLIKKIDELHLQGHEHLTVRMVNVPNAAQLERQVSSPRAPDGCRVEMDGTCRHGLESWFTVLFF